MKDNESPFTAAVFMLVIMIALCCCTGHDYPNCKGAGGACGSDRDCCEPYKCKNSPWSTSPGKCG
jgi:hypothetical protein